MRRFALPVLISVILVASAVLAAAPSRPGAEEPAAAAAPESWNDVVTSFDGVEIAVTVFKPAGASEDEPVPVVLNSHGWGGTRAKSIGGLVADLLDNGYGVVSFDARGHGESGGLVTVHNRDAEVHDFLAILDFIHDKLEWVQKDTASGVPKDIVAGATGGSYGGGYQLMTASYDDRLDALVPEITWNDLTYSLGSHGVIKSVWVDALYGAGKAQARLHPDIDRWFLEVMATNVIPQDAFDHFKASSPLPETIQAHVLLVQGIPDILFNLNEAVYNYEALRDGMAGDVRLVTHLGGHVLPGVQPMALHRDRPGNLHPCGNVGEMTLAWFDEHLKGIVGAADAIPQVAWALEDGTCVTRDDAAPDQTYSANFPALAAPQTAGTLLVPLLDGPALVAGLPHIAATVTTVTPAMANLGLVVGGMDGMRVVDDQSTGVRLQPGESLDLDLAGVATRVDAGETLYLRIDGLNEWYAHNGNRVPGAAVLTDVVVTLPLLDA